MEAEQKHACRQRLLATCHMPLSSNVVHHTNQRKSTEASCIRSAKHSQRNSRFGISNFSTILTLNCSSRQVSAFSGICNHPYSSVYTYMSVYVCLQICKKVIVTTQFTSTRSITTECTAKTSVLPHSKLQQQSVHIIIRNICSLHHFRVLNAAYNSNKMA